MAEHLLSGFKINKEEPENGIRELVKIIKPHWNNGNIKMEVLSGGYSSKIFKCFDPKHPEEKITVRIRNLVDTLPGFENFKNNVEPQVIQYLSKTGHFPKINAIFANGYCYDYIKGSPMINMKLKIGSVNEKQLRLIAKELVYIHELKLEGVDYSKEQFIQRFDEIFGPVVFKGKLGDPTKEQIMKEFQVIREFNHSLNMPLVLCHSDCHPGNFVWNDKNDKLTFVDWEGACISYRHVEVAQFLTVCQMIYKNVPQLKMIWAEDFENKFLNFYFQELCNVHHQEFSEDEFQKFKEIVHKCKLGPALLFVAFPLMRDTINDCMNDTPTLFDNMLDVYQNLKEEILGTRKFHAELQ